MAADGPGSSRSLGPPRRFRSPGPDRLSRAKKNTLSTSIVQQHADRTGTFVGVLTTARAEPSFALMDADRFHSFLPVRTRCFVASSGQAVALSCWVDARYSLDAFSILSLLLTTILEDDLQEAIGTRGGPRKTMKRVEKDAFRAAMIR